MSKTIETITNNNIINTNQCFVFFNMNKTSKVKPLKNANSCLILFYQHKANKSEPFLLVSDTEVLNLSHLWTTCSSTLISPPPPCCSLGTTLPVTWAATLGWSDALSSITRDGSTRETSSNEREQALDPEETLNSEPVWVFSPLTAEESCFW